MMHWYRCYGCGSRIHSNVCPWQCFNCGSWDVWDWPAPIPVPPGQEQMWAFGDVDGDLVDPEAEYQERIRQEALDRLARQAVARERDAERSFVALVGVTVLRDRFAR